MAAGLFEVGRPRRVTAEEAADIDTRWRDFGECATVSLRSPCTALRAACVALLFARCKHVVDCLTSA